ncbi:MAG: hypothetical protein ACFB0F_07740 [Neomegalonema sp.]
MSILDQFRRDEPIRGSGRVSAWRYVFGKRVISSGGPVGPGEELRITSHSEALPETLLPYLNPLRLSPSGSVRSLIHEEAPGRTAALAYPVRTRDGRFYVVQKVAARSEGEANSESRAYTQSNALVFPEAEWAKAAPALLPYLMSNGLTTDPDLTEADPDLEQGVVSLVLPPMAPAGATREPSSLLLAALEHHGELGAFARPQIADAETFWSACAGLLTALPPEFRPLCSFADGFAEEPSGILLRHSPLGGAGAAVKEGRPPRTRMPSAGGLETLCDRLADVVPPEWDDALDAGGALRDLLIDAAVDDDPAHLEAVLTDPAPPDFAAPSGAAAIGVLRRLVGAAHAGAAFKREMPGYGLARAAALIAGATDPGWRDAWETLRRAQPGRYFWSALLLREPDWVDPVPIETLSALNRLCRFEERIREGVGPEAPTPMDGPAYRRRLSRLAERGGELLTLAPDALVSESGDGPSAWVRLRADLFADVSPQARREVSHALAAIDRAARLFGADEPMLKAVDAVRRASLNSADLSTPELWGRDLGERWLKALAARAPLASDFWRGAFERHFEQRVRGLEPTELRDELIATKTALALDPARGDHASVAQVLEELRAASAPAFSQAPAAAGSELPQLIAHWLESWRGEGAAVAGSHGPARDCAALLRAEASLNIDVGALADDMVSALKSVATRDVEAFGVSAALTLAVECLQVLTALGSKAREDAAGFLGDLDTFLGTPGSSGSTPIDGFPDRSDVVLEEVMRLIASWSEDAHPQAYLPESAAPGLRGRLSERLGAPMAAYLLGLDDPAPAKWDRPGLAVVLERLGPAGEHAMVANAVRSWRALHQKWRDNPEPDAPKRLSQEPSADALVSEVILKVVAREGAASARWIGEDVAWAVRELSDVAEPAKPDARRKSPKSIFEAWRVVGQLERGDDLEAPQGFVLFVLTRLLRASKQRGAGLNSVTGPFLQFLTEDFYEFQIGSAGKESRDVRGLLRNYIYGSDRRHVDALSDTGLRARLDRLLLFLSLVETVASGRVDPEARFRAPVRVKDEHAGRLSPPRALVEPLATFLKNDDNVVYRDALRVLQRDGVMSNLCAWPDLLNAIRETDPDAGDAPSGIGAIRRRLSSRLHKGSDDPEEGGADGAAG